MVLKQAYTYVYEVMLCSAKYRFQTCSLFSLTGKKKKFLNKTNWK